MWYEWINQIVGCMESQAHGSGVYGEPSTWIWEDGVEEAANDCCYMVNHGTCSQTLERHPRTLENG